MTETTLSIFGLKQKYEGRPSGAAIIAFIILGTLAIYLLSCLVLYAFTELTGLLSFSWLNAFYTTILLIVAKYTFSESK